MKQQGKLRRRIALIAALVALATLGTVAAYSASSDLLMRKVNAAVEPGVVTYATLYNIDTVSGADLLAAGNRAVNRGGKVLFNFDTLQDKKVVGRIVVNSLQASEAMERYNFKLDTGSEAVEAVAQQFEALLGRKVAVIRCAHQDYGMPVIVCASIDMTDMDVNNLVAYTYDRKADSYEQLAAGSITADAGGMVCIKTAKAGYLIITQGD